MLGVLSGPDDTVRETQCEDCIRSHTHKRDWHRTRPLKPCCCPQSLRVPSQESLPPHSHSPIPTNTGTSGSENSAGLSILLFPPLPFQFRLLSHFSGQDVKRWRLSCLSRRTKKPCECRLVPTPRSFQEAGRGNPGFLGTCPAIGQSSTTSSSDPKKNGGDTDRAGPLVDLLI